ncbi:MAG: 30S ribosomal protein S1 [Nitrospirota bacterium]
MEGINQPVTSPDSNEENFADMLEKSMTKGRKRLEPGQMVEASIVQITPEWIFLDLGGKGEGYLDKKEFITPEGTLTVKVGDTVRAYFLSSKNNEMHFTTKIGAGPAGQKQIEDAWNNGIPVEGTITKEVKGGFEIKIAGSVRAFCPFSQTGIRREENQEEYIGRSLSFKITEYTDRNIVLSRRIILDEEKERMKKELQSKLKEGMKVKGTVVSIQKFGAFVDIGGLEGLIPASEIAWGRTENINDFLSKGQEVTVIVKSIDWSKNRISFSLKDALPDPWDQVAELYKVGSYYPGTVTRLMSFGAFVMLKSGVEGLIHISKLGGGRRLNHPKEVVKEGQPVEIKVEAIDREKKKLSLVLADVSREEEEAAATLKNYQDQAKEAPKSLGTLGELLQAKMKQKEK